MACAIHLQLPGLASVYRKDGYNGYRGVDDCYKAIVILGRERVVESCSSEYMVQALMPEAAPTSPQSLVAGRRPLPPGWRWVKLGEVCTDKIETVAPRRTPEQDFKYVDITSIDNRLKRIMTPRVLLGKVAPSRARQRIMENDILVSTTRPGLNAVAIVPRELSGQVCSTGFCVLRPASGILPAFLFAYVQSVQFVEELDGLVRGALYPAVTDSQVRQREMPLPPVDVQKRIVAELSRQMAAVEGARSAAEVQEQAAESLVAASLRGVFAGSEAASWPLKRLGDVADTCSGTTPSRGRRDLFEGTIPWVKTGELRDGIIEDSEEHVSEKAIRETSLRVLPEGTLLIAMYGQGQTRGRTGMMSRPGTTNQACFAILPNGREYNTRFLQYWFRLSYVRIRRLTEGRGGNQPNLNGEILRDEIVPLPALDVQARVVKTLDRDLAAVRIILEQTSERRLLLDRFEKRMLEYSLAGVGS